MPSNPFTRVNSATTSSDTASLNTTSSTSSFTKLLHKSNPNPFYSSISNSTTNPDRDTANTIKDNEKPQFSPGEKQREKSRANMETLATLGALKGSHLIYMAGPSKSQHAQGQSERPKTLERK